VELGKGYVVARVRMEEMGKVEQRGFSAVEIYL
jgi:hypothetical protein